MNRNQLVVMWITIVILVLHCMFPLQRADVEVNSRLNHRDSGRIYYLSNELGVYEDGHMQTSYQCSIDVGALIAQAIIVVSIGSGLIITLKDKNKDETSN